MVKDIHKAEFGVDPLFVVKVPGVIRFFGFFAEIYGGSFISGTNDKTLYIAVTPREDQTCFFYNNTNLEKKHFSINGMKYRTEDNIVNYVKAVVKSFSYVDFKGMDITVDGNLLNCGDSCLSSAVSIGITEIFNKMYNLKLSNEQLIAKAYQAIKVFCNKSAYMTDVITMINGGKDNLVSYSFRTGKLTLLDKKYEENDYSIIIVDADLEKDVVKGTINELLQTYSRIEEAVTNSNGLKGNTETANLLKSVPKDLNEYVKFILQEEKCTEGAISSYVKGRFGLADKYLTKLYDNMVDNLDLYFPEYDWIVKKAIEMSECDGIGMAFSGMEPVVVIRIKNRAIEKFTAKVSEYNHFFGSKMKILPYQPSEGIEFVTESDNENTSCK